MNCDESAELGLRVMSDDLGLLYESQDWGILNADATRLVEFIEYFGARLQLSAAQRFELGGLILASASELLLNQDELPRDFSKFLIENARSFRSEVDYWCKLRNESEFPLSTWLRAVMSGDAS